MKEKDKEEKEIPEFLIKLAKKVKLNPDGMTEKEILIFLDTLDIQWIDELNDLNK